jgi:hypothetical protein
MFGRIFGLGPTGPANNEPVQHEVNQRKEAQDVLEPAPPHPPAATLKPMAPDEITSLTKGGAGVDSVRGHLINANGGSRVLPAGHIEHLLSRLRLNDNRSWLGSVVYSHPNADLIKSLGQLQGEIKGNHSKIFQDPNFIPKGLLEAGNKQTADAINKLLANQAPARIEPMHAVSPVEPPPGEFPAYLRPEHEAKLDQALAKKTGCSC